MAPENTVNTFAYTCTLPQVTSSSGGISMQSDLICNINTVAQQGLSTVAALELGEQKKPDPNRPSLVLCRAGTESLWQIAKRTGATVESILETNHLAGEPETGKMLLIPIT